MEEQAEAISQIAIHKDGKARIKEHSTWFVTALTSQSKLFARYGGHDVVLKRHVDEAFDVIVRNRRPQSIWKEAGIALGGILVGIGVPNFIEEMSRASGPRALWTIVFTAITIAGVVLTMVATLHRR